MSVPRLNIIGCGNVGRPLARLWRCAGEFRIQDICTRSMGSATDAVGFVGEGQAVSDIEALLPADVTMIATPDRAIEPVAKLLAARGPDYLKDSVVFHCSGALASKVLDPLREHGARVASLHVVQSFADPEQSVRAFAGAWCGIEGDSAAVDLLWQAVTAIDGRPFRIGQNTKALYHAATVTACNYLVTLQHCSVEMLARAGLNKEQALEVLHPLVAGTVENIQTLGPRDALTGPIARGDVDVVASHLEALRQTDDARLLNVYRTLAGATVELSGQQGKASLESLETLRRLLEVSLTGASES